MKRSALVCVSLCVAVSVCATQAFASHDVPRKRKSFFEALFGFTPKKRRVVQDDPWWEDDDGVRVLRNPKQKRKKNPVKVANVAKPLKKAVPAVTAFVDPEVSEGLGMGNLTYAMPALVGVSDKPLGLLAPGTVGGDSIRLVLIDRDTDIKSTAAVRKAVLAHYKATDFKPLWMLDGRLTARGQALLQVLEAAAEDGLNPDRYLPPVLADFVGADQQVAGSALAQAQLDVGLTVAAITFAQHLSGGAFEPELLSAYHDVKPERVSADVALKVLAYSPFPAEYLKGLAPQHQAYQALKAELARVDGKVTAPVVVSTFPTGPVIKPGKSDARILELRAILAADGLIQPVDVTDKNRKKLQFLDKALSRVLKTYQKSRGIKDTGNLDDATVAVLGGAPVPASTENRKLIAINMERLRWLPKQLGARHVLVNQAAYTVDVFENNALVWDSNVIVGRPLTQTAVFSDTMETVVFNPSWGVPQSIILQEYLPKLRSDPRYLDKKGFQVVNLKGKPVKSSSINWNSVGSDNVPGVMQPPGDSNALGEVKFLFPNKHSIYMHDTPNRDLFAKDIRNFSHGCVRVEDPRRFAEILLRWSADDVAKRIDGGESSTVKLPSPVRVHLSYFTAWPTKNGEIAYFGDAYERDKTLLAAVAATEKLFARKRTQQLVETKNTVGLVQID